MIVFRKHLTKSCWWLGILLANAILQLRADVLIGTNDERFVGKIISESAETVTFESDLAGRMIIHRDKIRELQRSSPVEAKPEPVPPARPGGTLTNQISTLNSKPATNLMRWLPPNIGEGKSDWVQLKSGEWLKGQFKYLQQKQIEFDSDELDELTLKLKDVRQLYPAEPMWVKFNDREPVYGNIVLSNDTVSVTGERPVSLPDDQLQGITPSGVKGMRNWSGKFDLGFSLQSGNNQMTTTTTSGELARRTPNTALLFDYLGNFSEANGVQNADNQRINSTYDIRIDRHWFVRPASLEFFRDSLANISTRTTTGIGAGYYIYDRDDLEWTVTAGPSYQYTRFNTVEPGQSDTTGTPAGVLSSNYRLDITKRLDFSLDYRGTFMSEVAGLYVHHTVSTLSFEIKRHLNLDVSYVWDYSQRPQQESSGAVPKRSDYYLTVGLGVRF